RRPARGVRGRLWRDSARRGRRRGLPGGGAVVRPGERHPGVARLRALGGPRSARRRGHDEGAAVPAARPGPEGGDCMTTGSFHRPACRCSVWVGALVAALTALPGGPVAAQGEGPDRDAVDAAIARGVDFLKTQREPDGNWSYSFNNDHTLGITALAGLALLENGVAESDPAVEKTTEVVRGPAPRPGRPHDASLSIVTRARARRNQSGPDDPVIRRLARRLVAGERGGMWSYTLPLGTEDEEGGATAPRSRRGRRPFRPSGGGDNSNTQ